MNDPFVLSQAEVWSKRIAALDCDDQHRIARMYAEAFARPPRAEELSRALDFTRGRGPAAWRDLAHAIFNMKEFFYLR